jgi:hypothetical protein
VDSVLGTFIPALFAVKHPEAGLGREPVVVIACVVAMLALVAYVVYTRPRAGRCVVAFALIAAVTMLAVAIPRLAHYGVRAVGTELYYQQPLQFMFLILVALALRAESRRPAPRALAAVLARLRAPVAAAGLLAAGTAAYGALYVTSVHAMATSLPGTIWDPHRSLSYVRTFRVSVGSTIRSTGRAPVLFNAQVPNEVPSQFFDSYDIFFPMVDSQVRFNTVTTPMYVVRRIGALLPVSFHASATGLLARSTVLDPGRSAVPAVMGNGGACAPPGARTAWLRVPLSRAVRLRLVAYGTRLPSALRLFVRMPVPATVTVMTHGPRANQADAIFPPTFGRGTSGQYVPLDVSAHALAIDVQLPGGACVGSLAVGSFAPATH